MDDLHLINVIANLDEFEPALILANDERLRIEHANTPHCTLALEVLDKFEFALHIVDLEFAVPRPNENVRLRRANRLGLLAEDVTDFGQVTRCE